MLAQDPIMAFVATTDAERARAFYGETLGLRLVADEPYALVFDAGGTMLRVQKVEALTPSRHTVLGWNVPDMDAALAELGGRGVTFERYGFIPQDERGVWTTDDGAQIAWFQDPDGNTLSLTRFP
jgi:catechol 2,3-dioxygenase-like lactoylglutathione lyase family enzyme